MLRLLAVLGILGLVLWLLLRGQLRARERARLAREWDAAHPSGNAAARRAFIRQGMDAFRGSARDRLAAAVALLPLVAVAAVMYAVNND